MSEEGAYQTKWLAPLSLGLSHLSRHHIGSICFIDKFFIIHKLIKMQSDESFFEFQNLDTLDSTKVMFSIFK